MLLQTGGRLDHLPVFANVSMQPLQGMRKVQRKRHICDVRMARFDSDAVQRFEAAIALASAIPSTYTVDHHADGGDFSEGDGSQKEGLDFGRHLETHPHEEADFD